MKRTTFFSVFFLFLLTGNSASGTSTVLEITQWLQEKNNITPVAYAHKKETTFEKLGDHILAEFMGCENLNAVNQLEAVLQHAARAAGATVLGVEIHAFSPQGMSGIVLLQESHISIHTWPECDYVALDIFTCGDKAIAENGLAVLQDFFKPRKIRVVKVDRGRDDAV